MTDPFRHHPELRSLVKPSGESFFRTITTEKIKAQIADSGQALTIEFHDDDTREGLRAEALEGHEGELYVFAYGSLMWDPALEFTEVRRAFAPEHERRFILVDDKGGRGNKAEKRSLAVLSMGKKEVKKKSRKEKEEYNARARRIPAEAKGAIQMKGGYLVL